MIKKHKLSPTTLSERMYLSHGLLPLMLLSLQCSGSCFVRSGPVPDLNSHRAVTAPHKYSSPPRAKRAAREGIKDHIIYYAAFSDWHHFAACSYQRLIIAAGFPQTVANTLGV